MRWMRHRIVIGALAGLAAGFAATPALAQLTLDWPRGEIREYVADSGVLEGVPGAARGTVWAHLVDVEGTRWLRLYFGADTTISPGSVIRVTSLRDLEAQELDAASLDLWHHSTAYFNGGTLLVELVTGAGAGAAPDLPGDRGGDRVVIERVALEFGAINPPGGGCGFCEGDSREPSSIPWSARLLPAGCTATIYNDESCIVSAGHCVDGTDGDVVQFRVPPSSNDCDLNHPPIADQFPIIEKVWVNGGPGNDWAAMRSGPNNQGQTVFQRYGVFMPTAVTVPVAGDPVNVWGYGVDDECTRNQVQQVDTDPGEIVVVGSTSIRHTTDTTFGNSGSAIVRDGTEIIAIATHCPCPNIGTRVDQADFLAAREDLCGDEGITNDDCADAIPLGDGATPFTTRGATTDGPLLPKGCDEGNGVFLRKDVWFLYTASCTGTATASTCSSAFDTMMAVYTPEGCPGDLVACSDDACGQNGTRAETSFAVTAGAGYRIRIGSKLETGSGTLEITCAEGETCPEDVDGSGDVGFNDVLAVLSVWGPYKSCPPFIPEDVDEDCLVGFSDLLAVLAAWGPCA